MTVQLLATHLKPQWLFHIHPYYDNPKLICFAGAATAYGIGFTEVRWEQWGELALGGFSGLGSAALFLMTFTGNIWVCYISYVVFKGLYMLLITIAM